MTIKDLKDKKLILFEAVAGSRAYGLDTADSDTDIKGVFYLPQDKFYGLEYIPQISNETNDEVYYELGRFVELLSKSNPNIMELLASPSDCILVKNSLMDVFQIEHLLSKETVNTFAQYALVQVRKAKGLNKKINNPIEKERKNLLDFCYVLQGNDSIPLALWLEKEEIEQSHCGLAKINHTKGLYALFYDAEGRFGYKGVLSKADSQEVSCSSIPKGETLQAYLFVNQEAYSLYCKSYREYFEWINKRNETRFASTVAHGQGYDAKNMMHTLRLLEVSKEILETGKLNVRRPNRDLLLEVKSGKYSYDEIYDRVERLLAEIESMEKISTLKDHIDVPELEIALLNIRKVLYS